MLSNIVGENIKRLRQQRKWSQEKLSMVTGINRVSIARYEIGDNTPSLDSATILAKALGCTVDELIGKEQSVENATCSSD